MARELLTNIIPIEAGPVVINDQLNIPVDLFDTHLSLGDLADEALAHGSSGYDAELAMLFSVRGLINHLKLKILSPHEAMTLKGGELWGPYEPSDYYIDLRGLVDNKRAIMRHTTASTDRQRVINVVRLGFEYAEEQVRTDIDNLAFNELPGSVYSWKRPKKQLEAGLLIEFREFADTVYGPIFTGPGKAADVFDRIVLKLGDKEAVARIKELETAGHPLSRRDIRDSLYIKTQALADLIEQLSNLPPNERDGFNNLSLKIMRFVLNDESPEDHL